MSEIEWVDLLVQEYQEKNYTKCIEIAQDRFSNNTREVGNDLLRNIYIDSLVLLGHQLMEEGLIHEAKATLERVLRFEGDLVFESDIILYNVYVLLAEIDALLETEHEDKDYHVKSKEIVNRMVASGVIQSIYISFLEGKYDEVIKRMSALEIDELDDYNKGRYHMMMGSAYYYKEDHEKAIPFLETAIGYYKDKPYNSVLMMIYEELSKSYTNVENYKKAYEYLQKSQKNLHEDQEGMDKK